ncbi:hypothetical protein C1S60_06120 [Lactiplantibacillus plantarum]|nr:hypothetical protein [Lactiplantibacillus plantarum]MDE4423196.1 hypothetical protein [Lactiplantibacillus plantarum]MDE4428021.1 hypothetical protein [Lactiplantibacillus plantarum]MDE4431608.1 hypothetical protein [Lactiplantibacillus plantarum]MDE4441372.1 hypothetical protein [Lactiplantibacillus plantarum]
MFKRAPVASVSIRLERVIGPLIGGQIYISLGHSAPGVFADGQQPIQLLKRYKKDQLSTRCWASVGNWFF